MRQNFQNSFRYSEVLIRMNEIEGTRSYKFQNSLFCIQGAEMSEEYQLEAITRFLGYLHEVLGVRIRTLDTDTSFLLETVFCVEFTT